MLQKVRQTASQELFGFFSLTEEEGVAKIYQNKWLKYLNTSWSLWCLDSSLIWTCKHTLSSKSGSFHHSLPLKEQSQELLAANIFFSQGRLTVHFAALGNKHCTLQRAWLSPTPGAHHYAGSVLSSSLCFCLSFTTKGMLCHSNGWRRNIHQGSREKAAVAAAYPRGTAQG